MERMSLLRVPRAAGVAATILFITWVAGLGGCRKAGETTSHEESSSMPSIADVIARRAPDLMKIPGVVGVYEGESPGHARVIRVMVAKRTPELVASLPRQLEGHTVEIEETGVIRPMKP